jgi:hypothetical protein
VSIDKLECEGCAAKLDCSLNPELPPEVGKSLKQGLVALDACTAVVATTKLDLLLSAGAFKDGAAWFDILLSHFECVLAWSFTHALFSCSDDE